MEEVWFPNHLIERVTRQSYRRQLDMYILPAFGTMRLGDISRADVRAFVTSLKTAVIRQTIGAIRGKIVREPLPKSSKPRVIDLDANTIKILKAHRAAQAVDKLKHGSRYVEEGLVFARGSVRLREGQAAGGPLHPERTSRLFDARIASHNLPDIRLHDLRHTWATLALKSGIPVKVVQERLGHANPTITMNIYAHVIKGMQAEAAETVASLFA